MGRGQGSGIGLQARNKTRPVIPQEWEVRRGAGGLQSGQQSLGGGGQVGGPRGLRSGGKSRGGGQGVQGGFDLSQGIDTPGVDKLNRGGKPPDWPPRVRECREKTNGGGEGTENPTTQETRAGLNSGGDEERMGGPGTAPPPRLQRGTSEVRDSTGTLHRHTASTNGARPENDMHSRREYGLLSPTEQADDPVAAGNQVKRYGHNSSRGTAKQAKRAT